MQKKIIVSLLTIIMVAALLTGCGSKEKTPQDTGKKTEAGKQTEKTENKSEENESYPVIKMAYAVVFPSTDEQAIEEELNKILREKAKAEIDLVGIEFGNWSTQLNLLLSGGVTDSLDLFNSFWYTSVSNLVANGQVMKLDDLLASEGKEIKDLFLNNDLEQYLNCGLVDGVQYGIPCMYAYCTENIFYARTEDARKANIDWSQVNTIDDMSEVILKLKEANPDSYYVPGSTEPYWIPKSIDYLGDTNYLGVLLNPTESTTVENFYESEYFINFLNHVKEWKKAGAISPDPLSNSNPTLMNLLMGVANGTPGYAWDSSVSMVATIAQNGIDLEGTNVTKALSTTSDATTYMWHISSFCKNPEAAMRILNVLYTDPVAANLIANGIEGVTYVLDENGQMKYPEGATGMADLGWAAASMAYWPNVMLCKTWYYEPQDIYDRMLEKNKTCDKSLALGFTFDSTKVANQMAACANVVAQYYTPLMYGEVDIDSTLAEFQQALKRAGIDDIITEKQAQLDAWLKNK